jgi:hypothetical protein
MSQHVESRVIAKIKEADFVAIQLDESSDITGKTQLLAFSTFFVTETSLNNFYFENHSQKQQMLDVVDSYFCSYDLSWKSCINMGSLKGFIELAKQKNPRIDFAHCFLHR